MYIRLAPAKVVTAYAQSVRATRRRRADSALLGLRRMTALTGKCTSPRRRAGYHDC